MKSATTLFTIAAILAAGQAQAQTDAAAQPTGPLGPASGFVPAPATNFTGSVSVSRFTSSGGATLGGGTVVFEAGARTHWHVHPVGQLLIVMSGAGWMQIEGAPPRALTPGDVVWTPPNVKHWHGAARNSPMTHVAVAESREGTEVTWLEPVSDDQVPRPG